MSGYGRNGVDVLTPRYRHLDVPDYKAVVDQWSQAPDDAFVAIRLASELIRSSARASCPITLATNGRC